jgi:hypothetical protein
MNIRIGKPFLIGLGVALLLGAGVAAGALLLGGDDDSSTDTATTGGTGSTVGDINQDLIDQFAETSGGKNLASICTQIAKGYPRSATYESAAKTLGPIITSEGGDISVVVNGLLDRC